MMIVLSVAVVVIMLCLLGTSYAYYTLSNASTTYSTTGAADVVVTFSQSAYINTALAYPIAESEAPDLAFKSKFTASAGTALSGYTVAIKISLVNIYLDSALRNANLKVQLYENDTLLATKTGSNISSNSSIVLKSLSAITVGTTYNYELRVWLLDSGASQNAMMGKKFAGRIEVESAIRK